MARTENIEISIKKKRSAREQKGRNKKGKNTKEGSKMKKNGKK